MRRRVRWKTCRRRSRPTSEVVEDLEEISAAALARQGQDAPIVRLVNIVLMSAVQRGASDIHIEPYERELRIRYRIDGMLHEVMAPPLKLRDAITSRLKIMARLDIAEKRLPQDGRIKMRYADDGATRHIDFRVSSLPTLFGEKLVLRLLDRGTLMLDMRDARLRARVARALRGGDRDSPGAWCS